MRNLERLSKKATEWCNLSGYDPKKIKVNMTSSSFAVQICENKNEMDEEGVDYNYPYVLWNPYNFSVNETEEEN